MNPTFKRHTWNRGPVGVGVGVGVGGGGGEGASGCHIRRIC